MAKKPKSQFKIQPPIVASPNNTFNTPPRKAGIPKLTQGFVMKHGEVVEDYACDVGANGELDSNGSIDATVVHEGKTYHIICDWSLVPRWPNSPAIPADEEK